MGRAGNFLHESVSGCNVWEYGRLDWQMDLGPVRLPGSWYIGRERHSRCLREHPNLSLRFFVGRAQDAAGGCAWSRVA